MNNPLKALTALFTGPTPQPAPVREAPPPPENETIKVEVPADLVAATAIKPKVPHESYKQHNREIEQRLKTANQHRPAMITRGMPHVRGR
ncbi:MAG: hypothetical protein PSV13_10420 [Lacunisphaera sp.]|nr:hypothetical protein [Lacunisphaera sp.]